MALIFGTSRCGLGETHVVDPCAEEKRPHDARLEAQRYVLASAMILVVTGMFATVVLSNRRYPIAGEHFATPSSERDAERRQVQHGQAVGPGRRIGLGADP
jgi:hypothetical protein